MSKDTAKATLSGFLSRPSAVLWPKVDKAALVAGLSARVDNPDLIRQAATPYCGPASLTRTIAGDNPDAYVGAAIDLYTKGAAQIGNRGKLDVRIGAVVLRATGQYPEQRGGSADADQAEPHGPGGTIPGAQRFLPK